jgi:hypothetical protein
MLQRYTLTQRLLILYLSTLRPEMSDIAFVEWSKKPQIVRDR